MRNEYRVLNEFGHCILHTWDRDEAYRLADTNSFYKVLEL